MAAIAYPEVLDVDDVDFAAQDVADLDARLHELRAKTPAAWVKCFGQPCLMLTSHELVSAAFRDEATFPSAAFYGEVVTPVMGRTLQTMYGTEHRINRALVSPAFRQRLMPGYVQPLLEPVAHRLIDRFAANGEADLVAQFTKRYPFAVITHLLGVPPAAEEDIERWAIGLINIQWSYENALQCSAELCEFLAPIVAERRHDPEDDLISTLATTEVEGERLSDEEIFSFVRLLFPAGADTTYLGLGSTLYGLLTHPDQLARVRADPDTECRWAAEEGLRWIPPASLLPRRCPDDVVWRGIPIPGGAQMVYAIAAANRDPAVFDHPDRFDVGRRPGGTLTFGFGAHFCLGAHLARAEMAVALAVVLDRLPGLHLVPGAEVRITGAVGGFLRGPDHLPVQFDPAP